MSENEPKIIIPRKYETADEYIARRKKEDAERKKLESAERRKKTIQEKRNARLAQSAPYQIPPSKPQSKLLSRDQELALSGINEMNNRKEIADVKNILDITPSKKVPEGINPFLSTPNELGLNSSEDVVSFDDERTIVTDKSEVQHPTINPLALDFGVEQEVDFDEFDINEQLPPNTKRIGGINRRKSKKLRKSPKKSRKSRRKTTRKMRRHRRRRH